MYSPGFVIVPWPTVSPSETRVYVVGISTLTLTALKGGAYTDFPPTFATTPLEHWLATFTVPVVTVVVPPDVVVLDIATPSDVVVLDDGGGIGIVLDVWVDIHPYDPGGRGPDVSAPWYLATSEHGICWPFHQHVTLTMIHLPTLWLPVSREPEESLWVMMIPTA